MKYGYVRSATHIEREINNQTETLRGYGVEEIIVERSGHDLDDLLARLQKGDEVHVVTLDRISRRSSEFLKKADMIKDAGGALLIGNRRYDEIVTGIEEALLRVSEILPEKKKKNPLRRFLSIFKKKS